MASVKKAWGAIQAMTITLTSLASSATAGRESTAVDNTTDAFLDVLVRVKTKLATGAPANDRAIYVYAYAALEEATPVYPDLVTGTDANITFDVPPQLRLIGMLSAEANGMTIKSNPMSVAAAFGGTMPERWGIAVRNYSGQALSSTGGDHVVSYQGVYETVI